MKRHQNRLYSIQLVLVLLMLFMAACEKAAPPTQPLIAGQITHPAAKETSGIAASRRASDLLWTHNDSAGQPVLYAIGTDGQLRGILRIAGLKNTDWEDLASFELDGQAWLLIADTGDNKGTRKNCMLYVIAEPDPATLSPGHEMAATIAWRVPVAYPDGPHDCEAVAVDAQEETVFLLTKRTEPPALYSLPLRPSANGPAPTAVQVAKLTGIPKPTTTQKVLPTPTGRFRALVTAMDVSPDRTTAAVLTYGNVLLYPRKPGESWPAAFNRPPVLLAPHGLPQAEALCFSRDGLSLYVTGEMKSPRLLRYKLPAKASK